MPFTKGHKLWKHPNSIKTQWKKGQKANEHYYDRSCVICKKIYTPISATQKCCSKECEQINHKNWIKINKKKLDKWKQKYYHKPKIKKIMLERSKKYQKSIKGRVTKIKNRYKITREEYELLIKNNSKCKICNREWSEDVRKSIDHNHQTNRIRGLLCLNCNTLLGHAHDNIETLKNAIKYLEEDNGS